MKPNQLGKVQFYGRANDLNREFTGNGKKEDGKGLSRQSWALVPKIAEVRDYLTTHLEEQGCVHEAHPEVSFAAMNALVHDRNCRFDPVRSKATAAGLVERRVLLKHKEVFGNRFKVLEARAAEFDPDGRAALDDFYDALACLWTARRIQKGPDGPARALCRMQDIRALSDGAPSGANDLPMRIVY